MALTVGTSDLKNGLTKCLRMVRTGARLVVIDRGNPVTEVTPLGRTAEADALDAWLAQLAGRGQVRLPSGRRMASFKPAKVKGHPVSETIIEDRR